MLKDLIEYFKNKKVLILGFGREGISTYNLLRKYLKTQVLYISDKKENFQDNNEQLKKDPYVICTSGDQYLYNLDDYDIIMKSPGISFLGLDISKYKNKIKSQTELLLEFFECKTIGITGTKGKSTTSSLIYQTLKDQNVNCMFLGNIGIPVFDCVENIEKNMYIVLELSSHQLEFMEISPNIAIVTNIFEEHLDHYESYDKYAEAKCNIFKYQKNDDYFLYNYDNEMLNKKVKESNAIIYKVSIRGKADSDIYKKDDNIFFKNKSIYKVNEPRNLLGDYNLNNIMFVLGVSEILKLDINQTIKTISEFKTLKHRLELVGSYNGISFYDNSIGTIPMATIEAVKALKNVDTLIIGGMDRGLDYTEFIEFLNKSSIKNVVCMPKTGHDIAKKLRKEITYIVNTLEEAVKVSIEKTEKGKICLLSPAAASYGFFKNFEEKGDLYKKIINDYIKK